MALEEIELDLPAKELPERVSTFLEEADRRIDEFFDTERNKRHPRFIPSDPKLHYAAIEFVTRKELPLGLTYCEWGSGFGVGTCLATLLGYESIGIEIEPELVDLARALARDMDIPTETICASYIPEGFDSYEGIGGEVLLEPDGFSSPGNTTEVAPYYEGMDFPLEEVDLFYVYPWPGQQDFMLNLFDAVAGEGAILLAYFGDGEICCYRRTCEN